MDKPTKTPVEKRSDTSASGVKEVVGKSAPHHGEAPARKNHYLYQSKIDLAKKILGAKTETEALDRALDLLIYSEMLALGTEMVAGEEYHDVLGIASEVPDAARGA